MARFLKDKKKSKGAAPGSLIFIGRQKLEHSSITVTQYNQEYIKEKHLDSLDNIPKYLSDDHVTWICMRGLHNTQLIGQLGQLFDVPPLILEDILNTDERPKMAEDDRHIFIILKSLYHDQSTNKIHIEQVSMILGSNYLVTLQESDHNHFDDVYKRLSTGLTRIRTFSPDYLCYAIIDTLVDSYILNIEALGNFIEEQEAFIMSADKQIIKNIYHYKTELSYIRKNIRPVKEIMTRFIASDSNLINKRTFNYLKDLDSLVTQALEAIEIYYTMVSDQQNIYNSNINNSVNAVMKVLTIFSAVFIPLTFIVGIYGMNFEYMPELRHHNSYFILWGIMIIIAIIMLVIFKQKKWF